MNRLIKHVITSTITLSFIGLIAASSCGCSPPSENSIKDRAQVVHFDKDGVTCFYVNAGYGLWSCLRDKPLTCGENK